MTLSAAKAARPDNIPAKAVAPAAASAPRRVSFSPVVFRVVLVMSNLPFLCLPLKTGCGRACARTAALLPHPGYARLNEHLPAALAILVADVAGRRAAAAAVESHQLHAELVEVAVAGGVGLLDLDPQ